MTKYTTTQGDTWDMISKKILGSELKMNKLIQANLDYKNVLIFSSGVVLEIPELKEEQSYDNLPPWKRGGLQ